MRVGEGEGADEVRAEDVGVGEGGVEQRPLLVERGLGVGERDLEEAGVEDGELHAGAVELLARLADHRRRLGGIVLPAQVANFGPLEPVLGEELERHIEVVVDLVGGDGDLELRGLDGVEEGRGGKAREQAAAGEGHRRHYKGPEAG